MALTGKKRLFAEAVIAGKSNRDAAIAAGYSAKTAPQAGSRLVKDPKVAEYLKERRKETKKTPAAASPAAKPEKKFDLAMALMHDDPKAFLKAAMNDLDLDPRLRVEAAKTLMPFVHPKLSEAGKKDQRQDAANKASGRFAATPPPLRAVK